MKSERIMPKVVKGLECCWASFPKCKGCPVCPYEKICYHDKACNELLRDALELLKEQQPKTGHWIDKDEGIARCSARCSRCEKVSSGFATDNGFSFDYSYHDYCPKCGAKMENPKEVLFK